jgi:hypothetical protein
MAQGHHREAESDDRQESLHRGRFALCAERNGVDQPPREQRHENLGERRQRHGDAHEDGEPLAPAPMPEREAEDEAERGRGAARGRTGGH